jgi:hypothetical protein
MSQSHLATGKLLTKIFLQDTEGELVFHTRKLLQLSHKICILDEHRRTVINIVSQKLITPVSSISLDSLAVFSAYTSYMLMQPAFFEL